MDDYKYSSDGPICPYCGNTETPDEAFYYNEDLTEHKCGSCGEEYRVSVYIKTTWTTRKRK